MAHACGSEVTFISQALRNGAKREPKGAKSEPKWSLKPWKFEVALRTRFRARFWVENGQPSRESAGPIWEGFDWGRFNASRRQILPMLAFENGASCGTVPLVELVSRRFQSQAWSPRRRKNRRAFPLENQKNRTRQGRRLMAANALRGLFHISNVSSGCTMNEHSQ